MNLSIFEQGTLTLSGVLTTLAILTVAAFLTGFAWHLGARLASRTRQ